MKTKEQIIEKLKEYGFTNFMESSSIWNKEDKNHNTICFALYPYSAEINFNIGRNCTHFWMDYSLMVFNEKNNTLLVSDSAKHIWIEKE